jgi:hypothetical protein
MSKLVTAKFTAYSVLLIGAKDAFAHSNHGLSGSHWHATDAWGFVVLSAIVVIAIWLSWRDK